MKVQELMKKNVQCVTPQDSAQSAAQKMRDQNVGFLPVCEDSGRVIGTLTDRDIALRLVAEKRPLTTPVGEIMSREVVSCRPADDVKQALKMMGDKQKSRIVVIDGGKLEGVLSLSDLAQHGDGVAAQTMVQISSREVRV